MRLNGHARRGGDGEEKARKDRGEKEVVKDERRRYFGECGPPAHKQRRVGRRASAASSSSDRGIPSRDARINRFPVRPYKRPEEGGTGSRRKRRARRRGRGRGARARRDHSTRTVGTKERQRKKEGEKDPEAGRKDRIYRDWKPRILKKMGIEGGGVLAVGMEVFKTRRPMPCSRQKDTTRATFAGKNPRATGVRLLLTHAAATSVGVRPRSVALSLAFLLSSYIQQGQDSAVDFLSRFFSKDRSWSTDCRATKIFVYILLSCSSECNSFFLVNDRKKILAADCHWI